MHILGLIITIIIYIMLIASLMLYEIGIFKKKYNFATLMGKVLFLYAFLSMAIESWALVLMNGGFNVNLYIDFDFSYTLIIIIPVLALLLYSNIILNKKLKPETILGQITNFLLPALTLIAFGISTIILFFNIGYFSYLVS